MLAWIYIYHLCRIIPIVPPLPYLSLPLFTTHTLSTPSHPGSLSLSLSRGLPVSTRDSGSGGQVCGRRRVPQLQSLPGADHNWPLPCIHPRLWLQCHHWSLWAVHLWWMWREQQQLLHSRWVQKRLWWVVCCLSLLCMKLSPWSIGLAPLHYYNAYTVWILKKVLRLGNATRSVAIVWAIICGSLANSLSCSKGCMYVCGFQIPVAMLTVIEMRTV